MTTARILAACAIGMCIAASGFAQNYPTKAVKVIVPHVEGGPIDSFARLVTRKLSELWGQPVVVENRVGAGGTSGTDAVAKSAPDGYTLLIHSNAYASIPALQANLPYDPQKDLVAIAPFVTQPFVLVVGPLLGVKSVSGLVGVAKSKLGQLKFASPGAGTQPFFCAEKFRITTGIDAAHVVYKGAPEANADTTAGRVAFWFSPISAALKGVQEGKLVALGVTSAKRSTLLPDVPTMAEAGVPNIEDAAWWGMWAPAGIPAGVADKLAKDMARVLSAPDVREKIAMSGGEPLNMTQAEFMRFVLSEMEAAARTVKEFGIKPE